MNSSYTNRIPAEQRKGYGMKCTECGGFHKGSCLSALMSTMTAVFSLIAVSVLFGAALYFQSGGR